MAPEEGLGTGLREQRVKKARLLGCQLRQSGTTPQRSLTVGQPRDTERAREAAAIITQEIYVGPAGRLGAGEKGARIGET